VIILKEEKYCNAKEAASLLGISRATFYNNAKPLLKPHSLPARKITYYSISEIRNKFCLEEDTERVSA
jgi:predicted DNA-binding transcriptional regulator AlpA